MLIEDECHFYIHIHIFICTYNIYISICFYSFMYIYIYVCVNQNQSKYSLFRQYGPMRSRDGKSQRRAEEKQEYQRRERVRGKKMQMHEKVGTSRNTVFFQ